MMSAKRRGADARPYVPFRRTTYKAPIKPLWAEDAPWCCIVIDGRHGPAMCLAFWDTPAGPMCNYHAMQGWPDLFITKTITSPEEADRELETP